MVCMKSYKTVKQPASDRFVEKKSEFIGHAAPIDSADAAMQFVAEIKSRHRDATHNVWAYLLPDGITKRFSDDGEPSGTAGMPVLDVIEKAQIVGVCVVVTRYFGGVLLGAGGLVRAYSHASKIALDAAGIITMRPCDVLQIRMDYSFYDRLRILMEQFGAVEESAQFAQDVTVSCQLVCEKTDAFCDAVREHSAGRCRVQKSGTVYAGVE